MGVGVRGKGKQGKEGAGQAGRESRGWTGRQGEQGRVRQAGGARIQGIESGNRHSYVLGMDLLVEIVADPLAHPSPWPVLPAMHIYIYIYIYIYI